MPFQIPRGGNTRFAFSYMQSLQGSTFISSAGGFSPNTLFTSGEAGDWFDPSDLSRMFTNTTGTTPVTADGQTVALMLGQRRGANVELISDNIDAQFDNKQTGWTATATTISYNGPGFNQITDTVLLTIGRVYEVKGTVSDWAGSGTLQVNVGVTNNVATGNGTFTFLITASSASFSFRTTAALSFTISNISVKEVALTALTQSDAAKRPVYAFAPVTGRRNLLTKTESFDDAAWTKARGTITANSTTAPDGSTTADTFTPSLDALGHSLSFPAKTMAVSSGVLSIYVKSNGYNFVGLKLFNSPFTGQVIVSFNLSTGLVSSAASIAGTGVSNAVSSISSAGDGWYRISIKADYASGTALAGDISFDGSATSVYGVATAGDGVSGFYVWGAQLETGSTATAYQKVNTAFGVTEAGVPTIHWLQFDGTNDALASAATLNLTGTDEVTTCIGAFRDNVGNRVFFEFSPSVDTNNGSFFLQNSPGFDTTKVRFRTKGTLAASVEPVVGTQPKTSLFTTTAKVSTDTAIVREDGAQIGSSASDQGTGNMGNHTLYVASSGPGALFLNGNIYFLLVRGALTAGADLTALEGFAAAKTGVTI